MEGVNTSVNNVIINMWHIKNTNGLFYYSLDYINSLEETHMIILRKGFPENKAIDRLKEKHNIINLSLLQYVMFFFHSFFSDVFIFTPSSHPLPFLKKQLIIVHDMYPFTGNKGWLKTILFKMSIKSAKCKVGYINSSSVKKDLIEISIPEDKLLFCPNKFPIKSEPSITLMPANDTVMKIGLVGTDSDKKNYHELFTQVRRLNLEKKFKFLIYGHDTEYYKKLRSSFQDLDISLIRSDNCQLEFFFAKVNALISVCSMEGFGRPIATALVNNLPTHLIRCDVFEEFFEGGAYFYQNIDDLLFGVQKSTVNSPLKSYSPPVRVLNAYKSAVEFIKAGR